MTHVGKPPKTGHRVMRVAYLTNRYPAVSHSFIRREILAIEAAGHEVLRFSIRPFDRNLPDPVDREEAAKTQVVLARPLGLFVAFAANLITHPIRLFNALRCALSAARPGWKSKLLHLIYLVEACRLLRIFKRHAVDHVHVHFGTNPTMVARLVRRLGGPTYSFTVHGPDEFDDPRGLDLHGKIADAEAAVAISHFGRSQLMRWCDPSDWKKIIIARCGVDDRFLSEEEAQEPVDSTEFCCVARLSGQKGLPLLIEACALLKQRGLDFHLRIVGDGELRGLIEATIRRLDLQNEITLAGSCDSATVRKHMLASCAFVLPSFAEGLPVVIMEALALRRPVITTAIAGIPELVDGGCGWVIPAGSAEAIADALETALRTPSETLAAMGDEGRQRVLARHDARINGPALIEALSAIKQGVPVQ